MGMQRKAKITSTVVAALRPGETVMDTVEPGFGVRCQVGQSVYFVRKYANGQRHFETIGGVGTGGLTPSLARDRARKVIMAIRDGHSPAQRRVKERGMPTISELAEQWMDGHVLAKLKPSTARSYRSTLDTLILPNLGKIRVDQIETAAIARMHLSARGKPYAANRALSTLSM